MNSIASSRTVTIKKSKTRSELEQDLLDANVEFSPEELREFLAADYDEPMADPSFKERLRQKLWSEFQARQPAEKQRAKSRRSRGGEGSEV